MQAKLIDGVKVMTGYARPRVGKWIWVYVVLLGLGSVIMFTLFPVTEFLLDSTPWKRFGHLETFGGFAFAVSFFTFAIAWLGCHNTWLRVFLACLVPAIHWTSMIGGAIFIRHPVAFAPEILSQGALLWLFVSTPLILLRFYRRWQIVDGDEVHQDYPMRIADLFALSAAASLMCALVPGWTHQSIASMFDQDRFASHLNIIAIDLLSSATLITGLAVYLRPRNYFIVSGRIGRGFILFVFSTALTILFLGIFVNSINPPLSGLVSRSAFMSGDIAAILLLVWLSRRIGLRLSTRHHPISNSDVMASGTIRPSTNEQLDCALTAETE